MLAVEILLATDSLPQGNLAIEFAVLLEILFNLDFSVANKHFVEMVYILDQHLLDDSTQLEEEYIYGEKSDH